MLRTTLRNLCAPALLAAWSDRRWPIVRPTLVFLASLLPFGAFVMDRSLKKEMETPGPQA